MIPIDELYLDNLSDEIGRLVMKLRCLPQGKSREAARRDLIQTASACGYICFLGKYSNYHLTRVGDSCVFWVPDNKRGHLRVFRGKLIRISCWKNSEPFDRHLMAGVVEEDQIALRV